MTKIILWSQIVFLLAVVFFCFSCYAQDIPSIELIKDAKLYDGKSVAYQGEVVGDIMLRGEFAWLSVNDGLNAIGVWINKELIKDILYTGSYKAKGDLVEIAGIFHRSCVEHGGDLDIHAQNITKLNSGDVIPHKINTKAIKIALILSCAILLVWLLQKLKFRKVR